jgi:hypothetical protein
MVPQENFRKQQRSRYREKAEGAFPPSYFCNKLDDKLAYKVALQTNVTHF